MRRPVLLRVRHVFFDNDLTIVHEQKQKDGAIRTPGPAAARCRASVADAGPASRRRWAGV